MDYQAQIDQLKSQVASISASKDISRDTETSLIERLGPSIQAFPVGSVFISTVSTNPTQLLGYGTWSAYGAGKVIVGVDSNDTDFNTAGNTGGEKTHTLTVSEMPSHNHPGNYSKNVWNTNGANTQTLWQAAGNVADVTGGIVSQGGGSAHNNLQPYITAYLWQRTS